MELIHLPLENGEIGFNSSRVDEGGGQSAEEGTQAFDSCLLWHRIPGVIESHLHVVLVQGDVQHCVLVVHLQQVAVTLLGPELGEMVTVGVEHLFNEVAVA